MADKTNTTKPHNCNWFQAPLWVKLLSTALLLLFLLALLGVWVGSAFPWWDASRFINQYTKNPAEVMRNIVWLVGSVFGGSLAILGFVNALHRTQQKDRELDAARRSVDAEIFAKSVEQLGHKEMAIRLGGLYSLENLARSAIALPLDTDNKAYLNSLLETLAAFVRMRAPIPPKDKQSKEDKVATDVEAAIRIISRTFKFELRKGINALVVDIRKCYLPTLEFYGPADFRSIDFDGSLLNNSDFFLANFQYTNFRNTSLQQVKFLNVSLENTDFTNANLCGSTLQKSNLTYANFIDSVLDHVDFRGATLQATQLLGANITGVNLGSPSVSFPSSIISWENYQFNDALWDPDTPPCSYLKEMDSNLATIIDARTKEIRDGRLWEKYLAKREKNETS